MKNYKIKSIVGRNSMFGSKTFTDNQIETLKEMSFRNDYFQIWEKSYPYADRYFIKMVLSPEEEYMRFYSSRHLLPCELEREVGEGYKRLMKAMKDDIKTLKDIGII